MRRFLLVLICILIAAIGAISQEASVNFKPTSMEMRSSIISPISSTSPYEFM